jgi:hypothetical protein
VIRLFQNRNSVTCRQGECQYSVGVLDLVTQAVQLLHPYTPVGIGGQSPAPTWSPDGRWLAFSSTRQRIGSDIWLAKVGTWDLYPLDLPPDAHIVNWASPPARP